jgi:hypothetical protein
LMDNSYQISLSQKLIPLWFYTTNSITWQQVLAQKPKATASKKQWNCLLGTLLSNSFIWSLSLTEISQLQD